VALDSALPGLKHIRVVILFVCDTSLVLKLGQFSSALVVHFVLQVATHSPVALTNLSQDISLVSLLHECVLELSLLVDAVLAFDLALNVVLLVLLEPLGFALELLFEFNISLAVLVHILEQVDFSLVLSGPLLLSLTPLLFVLVGNQAVNHLLVGFFIGFL